MPARPLPNLLLQAFFDLGEDGWNDEYDLNFLKLSVLTQAGTTGKFAEEPDTPAAGTIIVLDETNATNPNAVAVFDDGDWVYFQPNKGWLIYDQAEDHYLTFNGTEWAVLETGGGGGGGGDPAIAPYRFGGFFTKTPEADEILMSHVATDPFSLPVDFEGSVVRAMYQAANPLGNTILSVRHNGVQIGTITISNAGAVTLSCPDPVDVAIGDEISVTGPDPADTAIANWSWTFKAASDVAEEILPSMMGMANRALFVTADESALEWKPVESGGGGGQRIEPIIAARSLSGTCGTNYTLPWTPTEGNLLIAIVMERNANGAPNAAAGWLGLLDQGANGNVQNVNICAKIVANGDTATIQPTTDAGSGVTTMTVFELDAAYIPAGGLIGLPGGAGQNGPDDVTIPMGGNHFALLGVGSQDGAPAAITLPNGDSTQLININVGCGYMRGGGAVIKADAGDVVVAYDTFTGNGYAAYLVLPYQEA